MLTADGTVLVVVDVQGKLARLVHDSDAVIDAASRLIRGCRVLGLPVLATEQNPDGLGPTVPELAGLLEEPPVAKRAFSCLGEPAFLARLRAVRRRDVLLAGIETHICIYQTALDLLASGHGVHVVADAVSSRAEANRRRALETIRDAGGGVTSVETALFEMMRVAEGETFQRLLEIVK